MRQFPPSRIVCRTEETIGTLYLLGEQDRIADVSDYAARPPAGAWRSLVAISCEMSYS
jgi:iron complex transport system substrate-binding protein